MDMPSVATQTPRTLELPVASPDGHEAVLLACIPAAPRARLLWVPALGVAARHYLPFADALAARGIAVFLHEWRGNGSSSLRASRACDWGYRELLEDIAASDAVATATAPQLPRVLGGHSLGGQLAGLHLALHPDAASAEDGHAVEIAGRRGLRMYRAALDAGVLLRPLGDVLYWMPPYCVDDAQLALMADATAAALAEAVRCA